MSNTARLSLIVPSLAALTLMTAWPAQAQLTKVGVVTTLQGTATVTRASLSQPAPLKFKDEVFVQDRITTGNDSIARILLGGRAIVTIRERSSLTITEVPGMATVDVGLGRVAIAAAKDRMKAGEVIEIRTPNAVAAIRGTVVITEVEQVTAQLGAAPAAFTTRWTVPRGSIDLFPFLPGGQRGTPVNVAAGNQASITGFAAPRIQRVPAGDMGRLSESFRARGPEPPSETNAPVVNRSHAGAVSLATAPLPRTQLPRLIESLSRRPTELLDKQEKPKGESQRNDDKNGDDNGGRGQGGVRTPELVQRVKESAANTRLLNGLSSTERTELLQKLDTSNGSGGSGSSTTTLSNGKRFNTRIICSKLRRC